MTSTSIKRNIDGIQYLRGIAALAVVIDHAAGMAAFDKYFGSAVLGGFLTSGAVGVDLFFVISGFIITTSSLTTDWKPSVTTSGFFKKRFIRIVPLMWVAIISHAALRVVGRPLFDFDAWPYLHALFLLPGDVAPTNIWTLRHEEIFYVLFAITFIARPRLKSLLTLWVISPFLLAWVMTPSTDSGFVYEWAKLVFHPVNIEFGVGLVLGLIYLRRERSTPLIRIPIHPAIILLLLFVGLMAVGFVVGFDPTGLLRPVLMASICVFIVWLSVLMRCPDGRISNFFLLLGNASYSVYLFHPHIESAVLGVWAKLLHQTPIGIVILGVSAIGALGGIALHLWLEKPLIRWVQNLFGQGAHHAPSPPPKTVETGK